MYTGEIPDYTVADLLDAGFGRSFNYMSAQGSRSDWLITTHTTGIVMGESPAGSVTGSMHFGYDAISFSDGSTFLTLTDAEGAHVARLYQAAFGRSPDVDGLDHWITAWKMDDLSLSAIAERFIQSAEFTARFGSTSETTSRDYVNNLYVNILGRDPDAGGLDYWSMMLDSGNVSRADLLASFSSSGENRDRTNSWLINSDEDDPHLREFANWYSDWGGGAPGTQGADLRISEIDYSTADQLGDRYTGPDYMAWPDRQVFLVTDNANRTVYLPDDQPWEVQSSSNAVAHTFIAGNAGADFNFFRVSGEMRLGTGSDMVAATEPWRPVDVVNFNPSMDFVHAGATRSSVTSIASIDDLLGQTIQGDVIFSVSASDTTPLDVAKAAFDAGVRVGTDDYFTILVESADGVTVLNFGSGVNYSQPSPGDRNSNGLVDAAELDATLLLHGVSVADLTPSNFRYTEWGA